MFAHLAKLLSFPLAAPARMRVALLGAVAVFALFGCAQIAYRSAKDLVAQDKIEEGLVKYQEAMKLAPADPEIRASYRRTREQSAQRLVEQGDRLLAAGNRAEAEKLYRRVQAFDAGNERAQAGLQRTEADARHVRLLATADAELAAGRPEAARAKATEVLGANPRNEKAKAIQRRVDESKPKPAIGEARLSAPYQEQISLEFKDASLRQIFDVIGRVSKLNFLFDKDVKIDQKASIFLRNSNVDAAIDYMLLANQLERQVMDGNTILIYPSNSAKQKEYQQTVVKTFMLANASAKTVAETLKTIIKMHDLIVDEKLNMIIARDTPEAVQLAEKLIAAQDAPVAEVMLEVEILEVARERLLDLGVALPTSVTLTPLSRGTGSTLTVADLRGLNKTTTGADIEPVTIRARKVDTDVDILANPRIRVLNREKAKISIGTRVPSITTSAVPNAGTFQSVNYLDVGLKLDVEPTIYLDDDVEIRMGLEVSNIIDTQNTGQTLVYTIGTRTATTVLRLKDGENQVLAGLINEQDQRSAKKLPGLGDIPVLGRLFGSARSDGEKREIVLSITPHLVRNLRRLDTAASEFPSGTENNLRRRVDFSASPQVAARTVEAAPAIAPAAPAMPAASAAADAPAGDGAPAASAFPGSMGGAADVPPNVAIPDTPRAE